MNMQLLPQPTKDFNDAKRQYMEQGSVANFRDGENEVSRVCA
jgi:hypothetical protein